jgi:4-diphosphocytidyl-2-C-methyl-D-erythritol kinase
VKIVEAARAKINLALHVTGRRVDGYHLLDMLVVFPDISDGLIFEPSDVPTLTITGRMAPLLAGEPPESNLVVRAIEAFALLTGRRQTFSVTLDKRLPVASGIGGGSADCAATLRALCRYNDVDPDDADIMDMALRLGADVPMCLKSQPLKASGIGETVVPTGGNFRFGILLANPGVPLSTSAVFRALNQRNNPAVPPMIGRREPTELFDFLRSYTRNDLEAAARSVTPAVGETLVALGGLPGARLVRMSGSGATCFALFDNGEGAAQAAVTLRSRRPGWWVESSDVNF